MVIEGIMVPGYCQALNTLMGDELKNFISRPADRSTTPSLKTIAVNQFSFFGLIFIDWLQNLCQPISGKYRFFSGEPEELKSIIQPGYNRVHNMLFLYIMYDSTFLIKLVQAKMPFGRFKGRYITELPVSYLEWFSRKGFPRGDLGQYLSTMFEIKTNGLESILGPIIRAVRKK